ncbi:MAG: type II toxin-antitoxin system VapC family toxin [Acetobacteraceae bacterium]|jgi:predicted nucleic-acid-binding protein
MLAIDKTLIVRYLTGDHPAQSARARALIDAESVFVCLTVLLETEWVLRSVYGYGAAQIAPALRGFAGLPQVTMEDPALVAQALDWLEGGMDFANALHLAKAAGCAEFVTFDRSLVRSANQPGAVPVRRL